VGGYPLGSQDPVLSLMSGTATIQQSVLFTMSRGLKTFLFLHLR